MEIPQLWFFYTSNLLVRHLVIIGQKLCNRVGSGQKKLRVKSRAWDTQLSKVHFPFWVRVGFRKVQRRKGGALGSLPCFTIILCHTQKKWELQGSFLSLVPHFVIVCVCVLSLKRFHQIVSTSGSTKPGLIPSLLGLSN